MAGLPWYAHSIEDYERHTAHLTMLEHGAYRLMLDHYYKLAAPLPAKLMQVHRICRAVADEEKASCSAILAEFFTLEHDGWHNRRADNELLRMSELSEKRRNAANTRHKNTPCKTDVIAPTLNTKHSSSSIPTKRKRKVSSPLPADCPTESDRETALKCWRDRGRDDLCANVDDEIAQFRDRHTSQDNRMADWPAAWRTWYRNAIKFNRKPTNGTGNSTAKRPAIDQHLDGILALASDLRQERAG